MLIRTDVPLALKPIGAAQSLALQQEVASTHVNDPSITYTYLCV